MLRRPPRSTRTDTLFPYTTLFRSSTARGPCTRSSTPGAQDGSATFVRSPRPTMIDRSAERGDHDESLPLRPDDLLAFRLGRLLLLLDIVPGLPSPKPMDIERISLYDFFADNPFLVRSEERLVGKECGSTCISRCAQFHLKKN